MILLNGLKLTVHDSKTFEFCKGTYRRVCRVAWINWLVCECSTSKMSAYCIMYEHKTYDQSNTFPSEYHFHTVRHFLGHSSKRSGQICFDQQLKEGAILRQSRKVNDAATPKRRFQASSARVMWDQLLVYQSSTAVLKLPGKIKTLLVSSYQVFSF